jgi:hypothetical protein
MMARIAAVEARHAALRNKLRFVAFGGSVRPDEYAEFNGMCLTLIDQTVGRNDTIYLQALREVEKHDLGSAALATSLYGLIGTLKLAIQAGALRSVQETVHMAVLRQLADHAENLLREGRKDPAAILLGSALEIHLGHLALKHGLGQVEHRQPGSHQKAPTPEAVNDALASSVYDEEQRQSVASWLEVWHHAVDGAYGAYTSAGVVRFLHDLRTFMTNYPA